MATEPILQQDEKGTGFEMPRVIAKSGPLPSLTHLCSYASSHTKKSTCTLLDQDRDKPKERTRQADLGGE